MTDSKKLDLLVDKVEFLVDKVTSLEKQGACLSEKVTNIEEDVIDIKDDIRQLHRIDALILDEVERAHTILDKHKADKQFTRHKVNTPY